jgi:hypothetical protein
MRRIFSLLSQDLNYNKQTIVRLQTSTCKVFTHYELIAHITSQLFFVAVYFDEKARFTAIVAVEGTVCVRTLKVHLINARLIASEIQVPAT